MPMYESENNQILMWLFANMFLWKINVTREK